MNRLLVGVLVLVVGIGICVSIGATAPATPLQPDFTGKVVIFDHEGWTSTVSENVRLVVVGENSFLIFARLKSDPVQFDCWLPLNKIKSIMVFDKMDDAIAYDKKASASKYKLEDAPQ